jgi:hypothetical protein
VEVAEAAVALLVALDDVVAAERDVVVVALVLGSMLYRIKLLCYILNSEASFYICKFDPRGEVFLNGCPDRRGANPGFYDFVYFLIPSLYCCATAALLPSG